MKRKLATSLGALALTAASLSFAGTAGAATQVESDAQVAYFVLYEGENYTQKNATFSGSDTELNNKYWSGTTQIMNNGASSMKNNTSSSVGMWDIGGSCTGDYYLANPRSVDSTFTNNAGNFDNNASCVKFL